MTIEEKELLLQNLSARLSYGIKFKADNEEYIREIHYIKDEDVYISEYQHLPYWIETIKPYLRPMSSMTEEEVKEFESFGWRVNELDDNYPWVHIGQIENVILGLNWLNAHYFDYSGLIEKGLALEAPDNMYKHFGDMDVVVTSVEYKHKL